MSERKLSRVCGLKEVQTALGKLFAKTSAMSGLWGDDSELQSAEPQRGVSRGSGGMFLQLWRENNKKKRPVPPPKRVLE